MESHPSNIIGLCHNGILFPSVQHCTYRVTIKIRDNVFLTTLWLFHFLPNSAKAGCNWAEMVQSGASGRIVGLANWVDFDFGSSTVWPILFGQMEPPCIKVVQFA